MQAKERTERNSMNLLIIKLLKTDEVRALSADLITEVLDSWANNRFFKKKLAGVLNNRVQKLLFKNHFASGIDKELKKDIETKRLVESVLNDWIIKSDFAEIKESLESSGNSFLVNLGAVNELLWKYPAKMVIVLSLLPLITDTGLKSLTLILKGFNKAPPDLITDIIITLIKDIEPARFSEAINQILELIRKIDTGSHLIGEPGNPKLTREINKLLGELRANLDRSLLVKSKLALLREKEAIELDRLESLYSDSRNLQSQACLKLAGKNSYLRKFNKSLSMMDDLSDQEIVDLVKTVSEEIDLQELSDSLEMIAGLLERFSKSADDQIGLVLSRVIKQFDPLVLQEIAEAAAGMIGQASIPVGRAVIPDLVIGIGNVLSPRDDEFEEKASEARKVIRSLLLEEEEPV